VLLLGEFFVCGFKVRIGKESEACVMQLTKKDESGLEPYMRNLREMAGSERERAFFGRLLEWGREIEKAIEMLQNFREIVYLELSFAASLFAFGVAELRNSGIGSCMNFQA